MNTNMILLLLLQVILISGDDLSKRDYQNWGDRPTFNDFRYAGKRSADKITKLEKRDYENHGDRATFNDYRYGGKRSVDKIKLEKKDYENHGDRATFNDWRYGGKRSVDKTKEIVKKDYENHGDRATFNDHRYGGKRALVKIITAPSLIKRDYENFGKNPVYNNFTALKNFPTKEIDSDALKNLISSSISTIKNIQSTKALEIHPDSKTEKIVIQNFADKTTFNDFRTKKSSDNWLEKNPLTLTRSVEKDLIDEKKLVKKDYENHGDRATFNDWRYGGKRSADKIITAPSLIKRDYENFGKSPVYNNFTGHDFSVYNAFQPIKNNPSLHYQMPSPMKPAFVGAKLFQQPKIRSVDLKKELVKKDYENHGDRATFNDHRYGGKRAVLDSNNKRYYFDTDRPNINRVGGSGVTVDCDDNGERCNYNVG